MNSKKVNNNISRLTKLYITGITLVALILIGSFNSSEASAQTLLTHGPYLQSVTPTSILIVWETDEPTDSRVEYGLTSEYGSVESDSTSATRHVVLLDGLASYTTYHYRVGTSTGALSEDSTLKTAGGPTQTQFSFAVYGDTETESETSQDIEQSVVDSIISVSPDFCLHVGDVIHNIDQVDDWNTFFDTEHDLMRTTTLFTTMGNHEQDHPNYFDFFYLPGNERWYSFDYGHAHFICLQIDTYADYSVGSEQYLWLIQDLANNTQPWTFVFFHVPPYSSSLHGSDTNVRATLQPLFDYYGVAIVFNGHDHCYERSIVNGVTYLETAGGGERLYERQEWNDWTLYFESTNHFVSIAIDGDILTGVGIRPDGSQFDSFSIEKSATGENRPPFLYPIGDRSVNEGALLEFTIEATDLDDDPLTYSADLSSLPPEASFNPANQTFSWTPDVGEAGYL